MPNRTGRRGGWSHGAGGQPRYPRVFRLNQVLQEVLAEEIERLSDASGELLTVTGVTVEPDLRHATVWLSSLTDGSRALLEESRVDLQAAVARQTKMKRTPRLSFEVDPAVVHGAAIEEALRRLENEGGKEHGGPEQQSGQEGQA